MARHDLAAVVERLEGHGGPAGALPCVHGELGALCARLLRGRELVLEDGLAASGRVHHLAGLAVVQLAHEPVGPAGDEPLVAHLVHDGDPADAGKVLRLAARVVRERADRGEAHGLALVVGVPVLRHDHAVARQRLERHEGAPARERRVEGNLHDLAAACRVAGELVIDRDLASVLVGEHAASVLVEKSCHQVIRGARHQVLEVHGVAHPRRALGGRPLALRRVRRRVRGDAAGAHGLLLRLEVLVAADLLVTPQEPLEHHEPLSREGRCRQIELHELRLRLACRHEGALRPRGTGVGLHHLRGRRVHEGRHEAVLGSGHKPRHVDRVAHVRRSRAGQLGLAVDAGVRARRHRGRDAYGLVRVAQVAVDGQLAPARVAQRLEHHDRPLAEAPRVKRHLHVAGPVALARHERRAPRHGRALLVHDRLARVAVPERRRQAVALAGGHVGVVDRVHDPGVLARVDRLRPAVSPRLGLEPRQHRVAHGPQVERHVVARHAHLEAHELVPLVGGAPQLADLVGVVRQRPQVVSNGAARARLAAPREPHAALGREPRPRRAALRQRRVVPVRLGRVRHPRRRRVRHAVLVAHEHVRLAGRGRRHAERHARQRLHAALLLLLERDVAAPHLVLRAALRLGVHDAGLPDLDHLRAPVALAAAGQVAPRRRDLAHAVRPVGEKSLRRRRASLGVGHHARFGDCGASRIEVSRHDHGQRRLVGHLEHRARKRRPAKGVPLAGLRVDLAYRDAAAHGLVCDGAPREVPACRVAAPPAPLHHGRVALLPHDDDVRLAVAQFVALRRADLLQGVGPQGQRHRSARVAVGLVASREVRLVEEDRPGRVRPQRPGARGRTSRVTLGAHVLAEPHERPRQRRVALAALRELRAKRDHRAVHLAHDGPRGRHRLVGDGASRHEARLPRLDANRVDALVSLVAARRGGLAHEVRARREPRDLAVAARVAHDPRHVARDGLRLHRARVVQVDRVGRARKVVRRVAVARGRPGRALLERGRARPARQQQPLSRDAVRRREDCHPRRLGTPRPSVGKGLCLVEQGHARALRLGRLCRERPPAHARLVALGLVRLADHALAREEPAVHPQRQLRDDLRLGLGQRLPADRRRVGEPVVDDVAGHGVALVGQLVGRPLRPPHAAVQAERDVMRPRAVPHLLGADVLRLEGDGLRHRPQRIAARLREGRHEDRDCEARQGEEHGAEKSLPPLSPLAPPPRVPRARGGRGPLPKASRPSLVRWLRAVQSGVHIVSIPSAWVLCGERLWHRERALACHFRVAIGHMEARFRIFFLTGRRLARGLSKPCPRLPARVVWRIEIVMKTDPPDFFWICPCIARVVWALWSSALRGGPKWWV